MTADGQKRPVKDWAYRQTFTVYMHYVHGFNAQWIFALLWSENARSEKAGCCFNDTFEYLRSDVMEHSRCYAATQ